MSNPTTRFSMGTKIPPPPTPPTVPNAEPKKPIAVARALLQLNSRSCKFIAKTEKFDADEEKRGGKR